MSHQRPMVLLLVLLAAGGNAHAQDCAVKNTSCKTKPCCAITPAGVRLYCSDAGSCKECAGSTFDPVKCGQTTPTTTRPTTSKPSTTVPTTTPTTRPTTTVPGQPSTTITPTTRPPTTTVPPSPTTTLPPFAVLTGPIRPNPRDRSIKATVKRPDDLKWAQLSTTPHTASQPERDYYEHLRVLDASQATLAVQAVPGCKSAIGKCYGNLSDVTGKLGGEYEDRGLCRGNLWEVPADGRHYSFTRYCLEAIRGCLLSDATTCARQLGSNTPLLDVLDIGIQGERCVAGAPFTFGTLPAFDPRREDMAPVDTRTLLPKPSAAELAKLRATHDAHNAGCLSRCGQAVPVSMVSAQIAHVQYEAECFARAGTQEQKERRLHFCQVKPFSGAMSPRWSPTESCQWCQIEHAFHARWAAGQEAGDWGVSRKADTDHATAHLCANDGDERLKVMFSCAEHPCNPTQCDAGGGQRGKATCRQYLPVLLARLGIS